MFTRILIVYLDQPSIIALDSAEVAIRKAAVDTAIAVKRVGEDITIQALVEAVYGHQMRTRDPSEEGR